MEPIYIACDHKLSYSGARTGVTPINDGTCSFTLALSGGATVTSGNLTYVASSRGDYEAIIDAADLANLTEGATYVVTITFTSPGGYDDKRYLSFIATKRGR